MTERYRVTPRNRNLRGHYAYGRHWPAGGRTVTAAELGVDTLQRLDGDPGYDVERLADEPPLETAASAGEAPPPSRRKRSR